MNVLFITSTFPRFNQDDQVPWLGLLVRELKKHGVCSTVFAPSFKGLKSHTFHSIPVIRFRYAPAILEVLTHEEGAVSKLRENPLLFVVAFFYLLFGCLSLYPLMQNSHFDIIHVHWPFPNGFLGLLAKRLFYTKLILTFHGAEFALAHRIPFGASFLRHLLKNSDVIIANSSYTKDMIQRIQPVPVHIIPFGSAASANKVPKRKEHKKGFNILFVGRLIERKGVQYLVEAIDILNKKNIKVKLDIVGNGPLFKNIEESIGKYGLNQIVSMHKGVGESDLVRFYQKSDIFVLPAVVDRWNDSEGLGVVIIEAMSFGIPVVASNVGGIPSVVKHNKNGLLIPEKNPQAIADAIEKLINNPDFARMLGANGSSFVRKNYNWESIINKTLRLYGE